MQTTTITLKAVAPAGTAPRVGHRLEPGSDLVARLISAPANGGRGLISLAGMMLEAQLPSGLLPGQKLHLKVVEATPEQLRVRIVPQTAEADEVTDTVTKLAGELAARGDGALLRAALHFADGAPLWLPGGVAAQIHIDPDAQGEVGGGGARGPAGEAGFVLHSPELGAIEVRLRMAEGAVRASVVTAPGEASRLAAEGLPDLVAALERATGKPAVAMAAPREPRTAAPPPPQGAFDGYA
jgi:Flagellar hook-length control protein FliK